MEQRAAKMMDNRIGQAIRQYTQQGPSTSKQANYYKPSIGQSQDQGNASQGLITYSSQATAGSSSRSFQDRRSVTWCFRCASDEHQPEDCQATETCAGRRLASKKGDDGHFTLFDGTPSCYSYDNPGGCNPKGNASVAPAAPPAMAHALVRPTAAGPLATLLDRLDNGLLTEPHLHVLNGIENDFSYRSHKIIEKTCIYDNLQTALAKPNVIDKAIAKELATGRYLGPYTIPEVEGFVGPFIAHPIGIVRKDEHSKPRMIEDFSHPHKGPVLSLNAQTDISGLTVNWSDMVEMTNLVVKAKAGAQGATIDIEGAFRTISVTPSKYWLGVIGWRDLFYIDRAVKFGGTGSSYMFEPPADAFCEIMEDELEDIESARWADDINLCRRHSHRERPGFPLLSRQRVLFGDQVHWVPMVLGHEGGEVTEREARKDSRTHSKNARHRHHQPQRYPIPMREAQPCGANST